MYGFKKTLAMVMAILTLVLSCTVVFAEDNSEREHTRGPLFRTGTYNGYTYTLDISAGSSTLISATGTYGTTANLKLRFMMRFGKYDNDGNPIFTDEYTINYGTASTTSLSKSYTVSQAMNTLNTPSGAIGFYLFGKCTYKLLVDYVIVTSTSYTYL